ncbi:MAG: low-specificity L-threonine aldolase [Deltaproteobacteria bacterium]|nr:low-specificity L-threonine aldolase [Deltaproteobacteria bacterium]
MAFILDGKEIIDLRSDTVTQPTPAMREAMAHAAAGDDVYGEDPTVNELERKAAELMGKQAGLFVASGTMGNLVALLAHCGRGDEIILGDQAHTFIYEAGGSAALGGIHPRPLRNQADGTLLMEDIVSAIRPDNIHFPRTRLICLENTHNRCAGAALSVEYTHAVGDLARKHGLKLHIDGARIFNAAAALGVKPQELAAPADSVSFCLSKALCAPVGSVLCGSRAFIGEARRARKMLGGGMRQAGILAAAGLVALETMAPRLHEDHAHAKKLAAGLSAIPNLTVEPVSTNIVYFHLPPEAALTDAAFIARLAGRNIKIMAVAQRRFRAVLHYWINSEDVDATLDAVKNIVNDRKD